MLVTLPDNSPGRCSQVVLVAYTVILIKKLIFSNDADGKLNKLHATTVTSF